MPELESCFAPVREDVAAKVIDGELIIIRLSDGTYYATDNVGARVWELIEGGHALGGIIRAITAWYGMEAGRVERDVAALVEQLLAEGLIAAVPARAIGEPPGTAPDGPLPAYEAPQLAIYRDMGNLLALDPPTPGIDELLFREGQPPGERA